jgi:hypothetical protein
MLNEVKHLGARESRFPEAEILRRLRMTPHGTALMTHESLR